MISLNSSPNQCITLKRTKSGFRQSTTALSKLETTNNNNPTAWRDHSGYKPAISQESPFDPKNVFTNVRVDGLNQKANCTSSWKRMDEIINHKQRGLFNRSDATRTHTYSVWRKNLESHQRHQLTDEQEFPPKIVRQTYQQKLGTVGQSRVQYHFGNLQKSGLMYFSVDKTLILVQSSSFLECSENEEPIVIELEKHVLSVHELMVADLNINDIERHPFGQKTTILVLACPWQFHFYSYQPRSLIKLQDLNIKFNSACQAIFLMDYCKVGNVYYLSENGEMGRIQLFCQNRLNTFKIGKKFGIREQFFKFKHSTKRKHENINSLFSFANMKQLYKDAKYYWRSKKTKGLSIICDRQRNSLYTLVETTVKNQFNLNRVENQTHREIRVYNISPPPNMSLLAKVQSYFYSYPPSLMVQITEEKLFSQIGIHIFQNLNLQRFQISGIHVPKPTTSPKHKNATNLIIVLRNGSRIYLFASQTKLLLNEMINLPNLEDIVKCESRDGPQTYTVTQKEPSSFRLITHHFHSDGTYAILAVYRRTIISLLFSQCIGNNCSDTEEVTVLWQDSADTLTEDSFHRSMFINYSQFKIYASQQFHFSLEKSKLEYHKYIQTASTGSSFDGKAYISFKESLQNRQAFHYPYQHMFIEKEKMRVIVKLRPIDLILGTLQKEINLHTSSSQLHYMLSDDYTVNNLVKQIYSCLNIQKANQMSYQKQLLAMLVQAYCDIDGAYYFQQFAIGDNHRNKESAQLNSIGRTTTSTLPYANQLNYGNKEEHIDYRISSLGEKIKSINTFRKFRHSDLCTSQNSLHNQTYAMNSFKVRSDSSIMKLIQKIISFLIQTEGYQKITISGQWISSKTNQISTSLGEQALYLYFSTIVAPIWSVKIAKIENSIYVYITEICKKILQLLESIGSSSPALSTSSQSFRELQKFCGTMIEYNTMLKVLSISPDLSYSEGLAKQSEIFEEPIFYSLQKTKDFSASVNEWRRKFPHYFSLRLVKTIKLQMEIALITKVQDKKQIVLKNSELMPHYLLYQYCKDGTLSKKQLSSLLQIDHSSTEISNLRNVNHMLMTDQMRPEKKIDYAMGQIQKTNLNLIQKQFLVTYALQNIGNIRNWASEEMDKKKKELQQLQHIIKIQLMIAKELKAHEKQDLTYPVSQKTKYLVNYVIMNPSQLQSLVNQLRNPMVSLIFCCCFWTAHQNFEKLLIDLTVDSQQKIVNSSKIKEKLTEIFQVFSKNIADRLPLKPLLMVLDQIACKQIDFQDLTYFLTRNDENQIKKVFWVPLFIGREGWSQASILEHYFQQARSKYLNSELRRQKKFMYSWFSAYTLVKHSYPSGRKTFEVFNESFQSIYENPRENIKQLRNFLKKSMSEYRQNLRD